ncbi:MAG TPA: PAS domain S-box protein [Spirochaetota bacterium]|nr:PAS domain S-box protein [Spirochaetota bacterium]
MDKPSYKQLQARVASLEQQLAALKASTDGDDSRREKNEKFFAAFKKCPLLLAISTIDDGRFIEVNDRFLDVLGYRREDVVGYTSADLNIFENISDRTGLVGALLGKGTVRNAEIVVTGRNGEKHKGLFTAEIIALEDSRYLFTMMDDITDLKRADEDLSRKDGILRSMFDATPAGVGLLVNRVLMNVNAALCRITGYSHGELIGQSTRMLYTDDAEFNRVGKELYRQMEREGLGMLEAVLRHKDGSPINVLLSLSPFNPDDFTKGATATVLDITDFKRTQEQLQESEAQYRLLAENARDVIWLSDPDLALQYISPSIEHLVGFAPKEMLEMGFVSMLAPESREKIDELFAKNLALEQARSGDPSRTITAELEFIRRDGSTVWTESLIGFQRDDRGRPLSITGITRDITERKVADERIRGHLALNMALAGLAGSIISRSFSLADIASIVLEYARVLTGSEHGFVTEIDPATGDNIILSTSKMPGAEHTGILHKMPPGATGNPGRSYPGLWGYALNTLQPFFTNDPERHPSREGMPEGHPAFSRFLSVPVIFGSEPVGEIGVADSPIDYDDDDLLVVRRLASLYAMAINRLRAEEQLNHSLREKEILIKELHHRVKNNLQVISSLLSLQSRKVEDERYRALFQESQNRIHAMALVHEKLYHSEVMTKIDFGRYINELTQHLFYSYNISRDLVGLDLDVKEIYLGIDIAVPCAMIVNELVSNALKYAFPDGRRGTVSVMFSREEDGKNALAVADDGVGMPDDFDIAKSNSLGMQIVHSLCRQIRGTIGISGAGGTRVTILF